MTETVATARAEIGAARRKHTTIYRHTLVTRITHWVNAICILALLMSGLQIFNAHPALYWGEQSHFDTPLLRTYAEAEGAQTRGITEILGRKFDTTGLLGASAYQGDLVPRGFPAWTTLPSWQDLATGRRWHFFFAWLFVLNGLVYLAASIIGRHLWRDLVPSRTQLRSIGQTLIEHLRFRFHHDGAEGSGYNVLQKLSYLGVIFVLVPLLVLTGLTMSPAMDAAFPILLDMFGGRQSARTLHFVAMVLITLFVLVHLAMVLVSGVWNNLRSMLTGWYRTKSKEAAHG